MFFVLSLVGFSFDQITKLLARKFLAEQSIDFGLLRFDLVFNTGAAYGIFSNYTFILLLLGLFAIAFLMVNLRRFVQSKIEYYAFSALLGGALGNTFDRLIFGKVTDFINIQIIPVFNVADILLNIGIILILYQWVFHDRKKSS